jgi:hypothetical protein
MNCFNIRELQGILKRKFFTDLVNSHDHKKLLDKSMIGLRYKSNSNLNLDPDMLSFYNFGIHSSINIHNTTFTNNSILGVKTNNVNFTLFNFLLNKSFRLSYNQFTDYIVALAFFNINSLFILPNFYVLLKTLYSNLIFLNINSLLTIRLNKINKTNNNIEYTSDFSNKNFLDFSSNNFTEVSSSQRVSRFSTSLINYDYKTGHYIGN